MRLEIAREIFSLRQTTIVDLKGRSFWTIEPPAVHEKGLGDLVEGKGAPLE